MDIIEGVCAWSPYVDCVWTVYETPLVDPGSAGIMKLPE